MAESQIKIWRLAGVAVVGAVLLEVVLIMSEGLGHAFTIEQIPDTLTAIAVGGLIGWMYELLRELSSKTTTSLLTISTVMSKITYQDEALSMLTRCPRHNEVLTALIGASIKSNFKNVPYVGEAAYLAYLGSAIEHSNGFQGVHRRSLRWFRSGSASAYLHTLRDRHMAAKTRIFIIDDAEVVEMQEDLADHDLLTYYWDNGGDVNSYWIPVSEFRRVFPGQRIPDDFALFDGTLLIAYDIVPQVVTFDLLEESSRERQIFTTLKQNEGFSLGSFARIPREPEQLA